MGGVCCCFFHSCVLVSVEGRGQSSSVMLDQKTQIMMTDKRVKSDSKSPPLMAPLVALQRCTLMTYWKTCPMAKRSIAATR
jgi:hypothetical protein